MCGAGSVAAGTDAAGTDAAGEALLLTLVGPVRIGSLTLDSFITRYLSVLFGYRGVAPPPPKNFLIGHLSEVNVGSKEAHLSAYRFAKI